LDRAADIDTPIAQIFRQAKSAVDHFLDNAAQQSSNQIFTTGLRHVRQRTGRWQLDSANGNPRLAEIANRCRPGVSQFQLAKPVGFELP
jgi:hypothetical protein